MFRKSFFIIKSIAGRYRWSEIKSCPLCGGKDLDTYSKRFYGLLPIQLKKCAFCGLIAQNPRLSDESLDKFYKSGYRGNKLDAGHCDNMFERGMRRGVYIQRFLEENGIRYKDSAVFEVGCAYGGILEQFRRNGCDVKGCDLNIPPVEYGASRGLDLRPGTIDTLIDSGRKADIVILSHVLEHVLDPVAFLGKIKETLKPKGILYVEVPGLENPKKRNLIQPGHLLYFNQDTICRMLEKSGYRFIAGNDIIQSIFRKEEISAEE